jgi:hypothetical protein
LTRNAQPRTDGNRQIHAFAFYDLRNALPALVALAVLFVAAATVDDALALGLILLGDIVGVFAAYSYLEMGDRGATRRRTQEPFSAALDAKERKARRAAARLPLGVAIVVGAIASGGFPDGAVAAATLVVGFPLSQVIFALWLNSRHSPRPQRG